MMTLSFEFEAMVRGYHMHKSIWTVVGEELPCRRENGN